MYSSIILYRRVRINHMTYTGMLSLFSKISVGGINTVIKSKAAVTVAELGDNYFLLGELFYSQSLSISVYGTIAIF